LSGAGFDPRTATAPISCAGIRSVVGNPDRAAPPARPGQRRSGIL